MELLRKLNRLYGILRQGNGENKSEELSQCIIVPSIMLDKLQKCVKP